MILGERSKVRIRGIKGRLEERKRGFFSTGDPERLRRKKPERKFKRKERKVGNSKLGNLEFLKQRRKILHSKELTHSNHL